MGIVSKLFHGKAEVSTQQRPVCHTQLYSDLFKPLKHLTSRSWYHMIHVYTMDIVTVSLISTSPSPSLNPSLVTSDAMLLAISEVVVAHSKEVMGLQRPGSLVCFFGHLWGHPTAELVQRFHLACSSFLKVYLFIYL